MLTYKIRKYPDETLLNNGVGTAGCFIAKAGVEGVSGMQLDTKCP